MTKDEEIKAARNKYYREYRKKNPERMREINRRYWLKKAEKDSKAKRGDTDAEDETNS